MHESHQWVSFISKASYEDIPIEVCQIIKTHFLDFLGGAFYCSAKRRNQTLCELIRSLHPGGDCTVIGDETSTHPLAAATLNAIHGHGFELDDFHGEAFVHPGAVVFPVALAAAEVNGNSGRDFILAAALGYELIVRIGLALTVRHNLRGFHPTGTAGTFAAAAVYGKLLGKPEIDMQNAIGIAGSMSSGIKQFFKHGDSIKRLHPSRAVQGGINASLLAMTGVTGPAEVFEGELGFLHAFTDGADLSQLTLDLGTRWMLTGLSIKPFACCGGLHAAITGLLDIREAVLKKLNDIDTIKISVCKKVALQNGAFGNNSIMNAQYSLPFATALTLLHDIWNPEAFSVANLLDPNIRALGEKIQVQEADDITTMQQAHIRVLFRDGETIEKNVHAAKGSPENPMTSLETLKKFRRLTTGVIGQILTERIEANVSSLDDFTDVTQVTHLLRTGK